MTTTEKTLGEIVADDFRTAAVFRKYNIDFCCKGGRTISEAAQKQGHNVEDIYRDLENIPQGGQSTPDYTSWPLDLLADYVEKMHHRYIEEKSPVLMQFLQKIAKVHGERHPELFEVLSKFDESAKDLAAHLKKEELVLFPFIRQMEHAQRTGAPLAQPHFGTVENPVAMMEDEHSIEGERFREIAELTNGYQAPEDACTTYRVAFQMLEEFEIDLHTHIHIENNILFPKSLELEKHLRSKEQN